MLLNVIYAEQSRRVHMHVVKKAAWMPWLACAFTLRHSLHHTQDTRVTITTRSLTITSFPVKWVKSGSFSVPWLWVNSSTGLKSVLVKALASSDLGSGQFCPSWHVSKCQCPPLLCWSMLNSMTLEAHAPKMPQLENQYIPPTLCTSHTHATWRKMPFDCQGNRMSACVKICFTQSWILSKREQLPQVWHCETADQNQLPAHLRCERESQRKCVYIHAALHYNQTFCLNIFIKIKNQVTHKQFNQSVIYCLFLLAHHDNHILTEHD